MSVSQITLMRELHRCIEDYGMMKSVREGRLTSAELERYLRSIGLSGDRVSQLTAEYKLFKNRILKS